MSGKYTTAYKQDAALIKTTPQRWVAGAVFVLAVAVPFILEMDVSPPLGFPWSTWLTAINLSLVAVVGAAAFNLLLGYTHQVSVAHAAFLMLGTMTAGYFGAVIGLSFWVIIPISMVAGAVVGAIVGLPALRFRGLYLLIATFGVHFFAFLAFKKFNVRYFGFSPIRFESPSVPTWLHWLPFINPDDNGEFLIKGNFRFYWLLLIAAALSVLFMYNVIRSREGRAFMAVAEHDVSAALIGINVTKTKLLAFAVSSAFVSLTGVLGSYFIRARGEDSFPFEVVLFYAIMIIIGGLGSMKGAVLGSLFFYMAPEFFDWARAEWPLVKDISFLQDYANETNLAGFGILIIVVLVLRPSGLAGMWTSIRDYAAKWPFSR
jgi:branched-chain amino acid transport system permease protein